MPAKRARLSHKEEPHKAVKSLLEGGRLTAHTLDHAKSSQQALVDDSRTIIANGVRNGDVGAAKPSQADVVEVSSDSEEEDDGDADDDDEWRQLERNAQSSLTNGTAMKGKHVSATGSQTVMAAKGDSRDVSKPQEDEDDDDDDDGAPTFGELVARDEAIEVGDEEQTALVPGPNQSLTAPNALTLTSVLTQALRSNDNQMLESCLQLNDLESIRKTIERLPSPLVATLLKKLSERLHRRPGRAGNLLIWVQWSLVAHGGYLATQQDVVRKLQELSRVIKERAAALQPLMGLKGRLDMLAAQVELRKSAQAEHQAIGRSGEDEAVIYVEGEESSSSDDDDDDDDIPHGGGLAQRISGRDQLEFGDAESSGDEAMLVNGIGASDEDEDDEDEEEDADDDDDQLIDDEALESDDDENEDDLSVEEEEDESAEEDDRPATRRSTALRGSGFSRR